MIGAILGDIIGSPYEFDFNNIKTKDFPLFSEKSHFTDDTVMTIAIANAILHVSAKNKDKLYQKIINYMQHYGRLYPDAGYGNMFHWWLQQDNPKPYGSFGNGSAMRVSSVGWLFNTLEETQQIANLTAQVTHNHPEGIKGAESVASAIYLARTGKSKEEIKQYIIDNYDYNLNQTCDEIRPIYVHKETCQDTVPQAIIAFLESTNFEDAIRNAVSLGGDCDTLTCITGGIAEAYYGIPYHLIKQCKNYLPKNLKVIINQFIEKIYL